MPGALSPPASVAQPGLGASPLTPGAGYTSLGPLLRRRCGDAKAAVRRAALSMMEQLVRAGGTAPNLSPQNHPPGTPMHPVATPSTPQRGGVGAFPTAADLAVMENACGDPALSVRRAALSAVSEVFRTWPAEAAVANVWAQAVLPLVADTEQTVQVGRWAICWRSPGQLVTG
jgi:condensin-2 complex subunit D3